MKSQRRSYRSLKGALAGIIALALIACSSAPTTAEADVAPSIVRERATHVTQTDALIAATIAPGAARSAYRIWLEDPCPGLQECIQDVLIGEGQLRGAVNHSIRLKLSQATGFPNIEPATTYGFWVDATNDVGSTEGPRASFTTLAPGAPPAVIHEYVSKVEAMNAVLHAEINTGALDTEWEIWIEDPCPFPQECIQDVRVAHGLKPAATQARQVKAELVAAEEAPNIEPSTRYRFWTTLHNAAGSSEGERKAFTTATP